MSLKNKYSNKYRVVKKLTGFPEEGKLYLNGQKIDYKTTIVKCDFSSINSVGFSIVDDTEGNEVDLIAVPESIGFRIIDNTEHFDYDNMWEVELISDSESKKTITDSVN